MMYFAFLRNVMIGRKGITAAGLVRNFEEHGAAGARSFISTGNLVFWYEGDDLERLAADVSAAIRRETGNEVAVFIRSRDYLLQLDGQNLFAGASWPAEEIFERLVTFLPKGVSFNVDLPFYSRRQDIEIFAAAAGELFSVNRLVEGRTSTAGTVIEKLAGAPVTTRNWNTIERLLQLESSTGHGSETSL